MGPLSYMRSVAERNVVMRRTPVHVHTASWMDGLMDIQYKINTGS